ncbi:hypothetical protein ONZ51_g1181 [Trametes cubensis]|uniref:NADH dehydrogenase [ubiquinone] iron-sulfur protein 4, mitochondrial n=1 Tax=Trametes cubensis TaxID=1111947 RepID=A0AAD7U1X0_9APHY|nr:hypothetical protein ONZ51_g1181 [Trametes cubensis]
MSLLRSCQQAVRRQTAARAAFIASRTYATDSNIPQAAEQKQDTEVAQPPSQDVMTADIVSGAPSTFVSLCVALADALQTTATEELRHRTVRIFQRTRSTTQSGTGKSERWRIDWDILPGGGRWENPLMGWASSADYMQGTRLSFRTKEDAIHFAEKQGWDYYVAATEIKRIPPKNYAENFVYKPSKLRLIRTK